MRVMFAPINVPTRGRTRSAAETLVVEDDIEGSSSLDNNCSHSSVSDSSTFNSSSEDENLGEPIPSRTSQSNAMSQKMAFEVRCAVLWALIS